MSARRTIPAILLLCLTCSCGKKEASSPAKTAPGSKHFNADEFIDWAKKRPGMTAERLASLTDLSRLQVEREKQEATDRAELVVPPPPDFQPEPKAHKLKLTLIPEKTMVRKGEKFRYLLRIQNVGRDYIFLFEEWPTFIKTGNLDHEFRFYVTPPGGKEEKMWLLSIESGGIVYDEYHFPPGMTEAQKAAHIKKIGRESEAASGLWLTLQPGETLNTRGDSPLPNRFRDLEMNWKFDKPGTYRIKVVYDDGPEKDLARDIARGLYKNREDFIKHMVSKGIYKSVDDYYRKYDESVQKAVGRIESNTVILEVTP